MKLTTIETGMSDFHKLTTTILRKTINKGNAKKIFYRDYKPFDHNTFEKRLQSELISETIMDYSHFQSIFLETLNNRVLVEIKILCYDNNPFMNKALRKAIIQEQDQKIDLIKIALPKTGTAIKSKEIFAQSYYVRLRKNTLMI